MYNEKLKFIDLFCGIGGFRVAFEEACEENDVQSECVFSSDIDKYAQDSYEANFGERPSGDITLISEKEIPDHDILFGGFPCQPFSIIGQMKGMDDTRGTLFFDIARIIKEKKPKAFILEKQKRERVVIVGHREPIMFTFPTPEKPYKSLKKILEKKVEDKYFASEYIREKRKNKHKSSYYPSIWHENKSGNICSYPYSCALRSGASHNYLLVNGERRLTPREMFRLQGFPDWYKIIVSDAQAKKQAGNAVPVNMIKAVVEKLLPYVATSLDQATVLREYDLQYNPS